MTGISWTFLILLALIVLAIAGSKIARRSIVVLVGIGVAAAVVLWLFAPAAPA